MLSTNVVDVGHFSSMSQGGPKPIRGIALHNRAVLEQALTGGWAKNFSTTASGLVSLQITGRGQAPFAETAAASLMQMLRADPSAGGFNIDLFGCFFLAVGMNQRPAERAPAFAWILANLPPRQNALGFWQGATRENQAGRVYATSMALLAMTGKERRLPMFQSP